MSPLTSRGVAVAVAGVLAAALVTATASACSPSTAKPSVASPAPSPSATLAAASPSAASAAADWLAGQMVDGSHFESDFSGKRYPDQGLTLDAVFAFAASHRDSDYQARALAWLTRPDILTGYVGKGGDEAYAGATAKLALAVEVLHGNASDVGGRDLIAMLRALQQPSGRFADRSSFGDYSNALSQSFAILALARTPGGIPAPAATFLADSHCADGGFPLDFGKATCASEVDSTAFAVQALAAAGDRQDAAAGVAWLIAAQQADGGFIDTSGENANSTGLAAQALWSAGRPFAALRAMGFLRRLQIGCSGSAADRGAIQLAPGPFDAPSARRATAQAVPGLAGIGFAQLDSTGPAAAAPVLACAP